LFGCKKNTPFGVNKEKKGEDGDNRLHPPESKKGEGRERGRGVEVLLLSIAGGGEPDYCSSFFSDEGEGEEGA